MTSRAWAPAIRNVAENPKGSGIDRGGLRDLIPAIGLGLFLLGVLAVSYFLSVDSRNQYLVVAPPDWSAARTINLILAGDGRLLRQGRFANVLIATSEQADFARVLRGAGAWLVVPAPGDWGCSTSSIPGEQK
ncbi:hypothetical protein ACFO8O_00110 [Hephaestia sp. GCM10023244]|uniref:hypothetical protein n=1 Tax=unclassified Hephaestia TaxID=2631281 RepID=UPI002076F665|nr:hypothetical protein [Hephaestia sp. MAHUQ-44]MCM8729369.1 hypothetical protein [Hephaestia sp. MAHUQ-44]